MNSVFFRVDGNGQMGLGHLMRCLALAQWLDKEDVDLVFAVSASSVPYCKSRHDWVGRVVVVPDTDPNQELDWLIRQPAFARADVVLLDGYQFTAAYRQRLAGHCTLALFDDNNDSGPLYADLVINGAANAASLGYHITAPNAVLCLGEAYRVLRLEFMQQRPVPWPGRHQLLLSFGGSDPANITLPLLQALQDIKASMPIRVITGAAYGQLPALRSLLASTSLTIQHLHDWQQMSDAYSHARLAVSAAGGSQFELLSCATPCMLMVVADNQLNATTQAASQGWCVAIDARNTVNMAALAEHIMALWNDHHGLLAMHHKAQQHADCQGAGRVVAQLFNLVRQKACS